MVATPPQSSAAHRASIGGALSSSLAGAPDVLRVIRGLGRNVAFDGAIDVSFTANHTEV